MRHRVFNGFGHHDITEVRLQVSAQQVKAEALDGTEVIGSMDFGPPKHSASCNGQALTLWAGTVGAPAPIAFTADRYSTVLYKSIDGSLVIRAGDTGVGIIFGIPVGSSEYYWRRYPAAERP